MKSLHTICYKSRSIENLSTAAINELLGNAFDVNAALGINGILLHSIGNFFQVLEGQKDQITLLYERIKKDSRHYDLFEIFNRPSVMPIFTQYSSNFQVPTTNGDLEQIRQYLKTHAATNTTDKIERLLRPFIFFD